MTWLLCDYGEVLSLPQPPEDRAALEEAARQPGPGFWEAYWRHRPGYDRGDAAADYWTAVLHWRPDPPTLERLVARDTASWLHPNADAVAAAVLASGRGLRLAVLSNAPFEVAAAIDRLDWLALFTPRLFSCHLGAVKPERSAYLAALAALDADSRDVIFLDDRPANVEAAHEVGMRAELFTSSDQIDGARPRR
jgi:putative hydrolase of the HAD superfamily